MGRTMSATFPAWVKGYTAIGTNFLPQHESGAWGNKSLLNLSKSLTLSPRVSDAGLLKSLAKGYFTRSVPKDQIPESSVYLWEQRQVNSVKGYTINRQKATSCAQTHIYEETIQPARQYLAFLVFKKKKKLRKRVCLLSTGRMLRFKESPCGAKSALKAIVRHREMIKAAMFKTKWPTQRLNHLE